jgi:mannose-6-phosphate isomerase-like protein (cupin superfamily)
MQYERTIVKKPWGYEYLVYQNDNVALWFLYIGHDQQTSMHCHPNKTTGLILLDGEAELSFLTNTVNVKPVTKVMIRKGLFHSTKAISENGACVFEIETPVDKHDLVRLDDKYGREGTPYEDSTFETPKAEDCLWINDSDSDYNFSGCNLKVEVIDSVNTFNKKDDEENIILLRGGIKTDNGNFVAQAGDVVSSVIVKRLIKLFTQISDNTIIMTIKRNETNE